MFCLQFSRVVIKSSCLSPSLLPPFTLPSPVDLAGWQQKFDRDSDPQGAAAGSSDDTSGSDSEEEGADAVAMETTTSEPIVLAVTHTPQLPPSTYTQ